MANNSYEEFYYRTFQENRSIDEIIEYFKQHDQRGPYENEMFCPECCQAELKFVPEGKTHRAYLSAIDTEKHSDVCGYRYDSSPTKYTKLHFDKLTNAQIEDKMASILRMLDSKNLNGGNVGKPRLPNVNANPFILSSDDEWSEYPACSKQYDADKAACNKMKTNDNAKKRSCWASASERLAYCGKHKGKTGFPALLNK